MTARFKIAWSVLLGSSILIGGCAVGPDFVAPPAPDAERYTGEPTRDPGQGQRFSHDAGIQKEWWKAFRSKAIDDLVARALAQNPTVQAMEASLRAAVANTDAQRGAFFPQVSANASATANRTSAELSSPTDAGSKYYRLYTAQVQVAYVPDIWGGNRRAVESLEAQAEAQKWQLEAARLALAANVVNAAIFEAQLRAQLAATREIITLSQKLLVLSERRLALNDIATVDVLAQRAALQQAIQSLPPLEKQLTQQRNLLTALAGQFSNDEVAEQFDLASFRLPRALPVVIPARLARQRPDVLAAEANMHAAAAGIGVAIANRLPNISLTGVIGSTTTSFAHLFNPSTIAWTVGASVAQTVFDGGTLLNKQRAAEALYDQAASQYRATVVGAFQNVADALRALQADARTYAAAGATENTARRSFEIVRKQNKLGAASGLAIINAQQALVQASLARIQAQATRLADTNALFMAVGGSLP